MAKKKTNGKFNAGSKAYVARQAQLARITQRIAEGKSFSDLQGPVVVKAG